MIEVSNASRIVFPAIGRTKGDVVAYYEKIAARALVHVSGRPMSIRRFPKGLLGPGFFQKNVPPHYPESIGRFSVPRRPTSTKKHPAKNKPGKAAEDFTIYPVLSELEHLPYLANQGAIELHVPMARAKDAEKPDRIVIDLDPPPDGLDRARRAAHHVREALLEHGLASTPIATGSKGYHVVCAVTPSVAGDEMAQTTQKLAALLVAKHPEDCTIAFRIVQREKRVFIDWLRNVPHATVIAPYSLRARPQATVATPLSWDELDTTASDAFTIADVDRLLDRPDPLAELAKTPGDATRFAASVGAAFDAAGLVFQTFDRFRS